MIRLQINPAFADLLRSHNLHSYPLVMQTSLGTLVEENSLRDIRYLDLGANNFYLKRTRGEKFSSALESYCRGRLAHSRPFKEMMQFRLLEQSGFEVAEVVAAGEELHCGVPAKGFIITREVAGRDLSRVYREADQSARNSILVDFGSLLGRLHSNGFFGSTRLKDIISSGNPGDSLKLTLIDRETRNPYRKKANRDKVIARLLLNIRRQAQQGEIFTRGEWESFAGSYCRSLDSSFGIDAPGLFTEILAQLDRPGKEYLAQ